MPRVRLALLIVGFSLLIPAARLSGQSTALSPQSRPSPLVLPAAHPDATAARLPQPSRTRSGTPFPAIQWLRARAENAALLRARAADSTVPASWQAVGPLQVSTAAWGPVTGSVTSIAADPSDPSGSTVYLGTAGGGIWKATNADATAGSVRFLPLTDDLSAFSSADFSSLSIGSVSVQPGGSGVVLAGTGNPDEASDSWYGAGLLRSADGGNTWNLITQTQPELSAGGTILNFIGNAFAGFAWSTVTPGLVVAAVTQSTYADVLGASNADAILGLYYSTDAGLTWQLATLQDGSSVVQSASEGISGGNAATAIVWNPVRGRFYAAIRHHGYYESADGVTFTRLQNQPGTGLSVPACPTNPGLPGSAGCPIERGALAVQPVTGDLFALTVDQYNNDQGLWRDACQLLSGACASPTVQFATRIADGPLESISGDGTIPQATYDLWLSAVPSQQDTLLFAGTTDIWRCSLANACVWRNTTNTQTCDSAQVAPNQLAVDATFGAAGLLFFGNDGGLWRSTDAVNQQQPPCSTDDATHYQNLNGGLGSLAEVPSFSQDPADASVLLAALGALGTATPSAGSSLWNQVLDGEGDAVAIDPENPDNWYATSVFGVGINRCTQGVSCDAFGFGSVAIGESQVENDFQSIPAPWLLDPLNPANLILGTCRVWRGPATGLGWSDANLLSGLLDGQQNSFCNGDAEIRSLAVAPDATGSAGSGAERIYAGMAGVADGGGTIPGQIFTAEIDEASAASGTSWTSLYGSPVSGEGLFTQFNPGGFDISSVYIDPHDSSAQTVYVTVQGLSNSSQSEAIVYRSSDAGAHWTNLTANLPLAPANSIVVDPNNANIVYVALDTGVYYTLDYTRCTSIGAVCWNILGTGLPNAPVTSLMVFSQGSTQLLRAATWGRGIWQIGLLTAGTIPTTVTIAPDALAFPSEPVQTSSGPQTITVTNSGPVALNVTAVTVAGDFAESDTCSGQAVAPQRSCAVTVLFDPTQTGTRQGSITLFANLSGGGEVTVPLSGTGLTPGTIVITPSSLAFGAVVLGSVSNPQALDIANTGSAPVTINSQTATGDFFLASSTCQATLAAQTSCEIDVVFQPTASGSRNGSFSLVDSTGTHTVLLSGTGQTAASDALSPLSLTFGAQAIGGASAVQQVTLSNTGSQSLAAIAVSVTGDFTAASTCGALLQGNASCSIAVAYVPTATGPQSGALTVSDVLRTQTVGLSGTGVAPPGISASPIALTFAPLALGSASAPQFVTVANNGGFIVNALSVAVSNPAFSITGNNCPASLGIGSSCQIGIAFTPSAAGAANGTLTVSASNLARPLVVPLAGTGADFTLSVSGSASAVISSGQTAAFSLQLASVQGSSGTVALACSGLPQNAACTLNPVSIAVSGANTASVSVAIATGAASGTAASLRSGNSWLRIFPAMAFLIPFGAFGPRRKFGAVAALCVLAVVLLGCGVAASPGSPATGTGSGTGSSGGSQNTTPSGTYPIVITGTMGSIAHSITVTVTVQ